ASLSRGARGGVRVFRRRVRDAAVRQFEQRRRKILRGFRREETTRFLAFRSHWQFDAAFCTPGEGHEKGGVEGEVGYFRRNHWVPVPQAVDLDALNAQLLADCRADEARVIHPRPHTVGEAVTIERASLRPLADEPF